MGVAWFGVIILMAMIWVVLDVSPSPLVSRVSSPSNGLNAPSLPPRFLLTLASRKGEEANPLFSAAYSFPKCGSGYCLPKAPGAAPLIAPRWG